MIQANKFFHSMVNVTLKIGGEAGFGIMTTGLMLGKIATRSGYYVFEYTEYPSLIRGGHNVVEVRISDQKVYSQERGVDVLVCLNAETLKLHQSEVKPKGLITLDQDKTDFSKLGIAKRSDVTYVHIPFSKMIQEAALTAVMLNNIALGVIMDLMDADVGILHDLIVENFARKGQEVIDKNMQAAKLGYDYVKSNYPQGYQIK